MPRRQRKEAKSKRLLPDQKYNSVLVRQFSNMLMKDGKYSVAYKHLCCAIDLVIEKTQGPLAGDAKQKAVGELFEALIQKAGPEVEVKTKRLGGATYPVPVVVQAQRRITLAFRWLIQYARKRQGAIFNCLAQEFLDLKSSDFQSKKFSGSIIKFLSNSAIPKLTSRLTPS